MLLTKPQRLFPVDYTSLLKQLLDEPVKLNRRTGKGIRAVAGGASFKLDLSDRKMPVCGVRKLYPGTAAAEVAWFLSGARDTKWLDRYCKIWKPFAEPDGGVDAAYGYRWRTHFGRDQLRDAVDALTVNPSDRRIYVSAWDPTKDGLGRPSKNVPCPVGFTLSLQQVYRADEDGPAEYTLHSSLFIRSSDVFVGLPYDVMGHAILMDVLCASLGVPATLGTMTVTLAHPHLYDVHTKMAEESLVAIPTYSNVPLMGFATLGDVTDDPDGFVASYRERASKAEWPTFKCNPELVL